MRREFWQSLNDLVVLFTARPIALPLLALLLIKIYMISPETLVYAAALTLLSALSSLRWGFHYLTIKRDAFYDELKRQQARQSSSQTKHRRDDN